MKEQMSENSRRCDWCGKPNIKKGMTFWRNEKENVNVCKICGDEAKAQEEAIIHSLDHIDDWRELQ